MRSSPFNTAGPGIVEPLSRAMYAVTCSAAAHCNRDGKFELMRCVSHCFVHNAKNRRTRLCSDKTV